MPRSTAAEHAAPWQPGFGLAVGERTDRRAGVLGDDQGISNRPDDDEDEFEDGDDDDDDDDESDDADELTEPD
jgi:hypothetical protein